LIVERLKHPGAKDTQKRNRFLHNVGVLPVAASAHGQ
jgi:hypothetical protein